MDTLGVVILGSTGSIGVNTLDVLARHPDRYHVFALTGAKNVQTMYAQCLQFVPRYAVMVDPVAASTLKQALEAAHAPTKVLSGEAALCEMAAHPDAPIVMAAIVGIAGLSSALAAVKAGKRVLLANKESLVVGGAFFMQAVQDSGAILLPIDSEHNAIFQSLPSYSTACPPNKAGMRRLILTASGGPFRTHSAENLEFITPEQACRHPNWSMGQKISVDSATLMNKGLEVIEAKWLFDVSPEQIEVVVHPQSVIHSMVEYEDGSILAELGHPDMRTPIAHALAWPDRIQSGVKPFDFFELTELHFEKPNTHHFPCLELAYDALNKGGAAPTVLNAANEWAVEAFLNRRIRFVDIPKKIEWALEQSEAFEATSVEALFDADQAIRAQLNSVC